jgi:hypothetical protein
MDGEPQVIIVQPIQGISLLILRMWLPCIQSARSRHGAHLLLGNPHRHRVGPERTTARTRAFHVEALRIVALVQ